MSEDKELLKKCWDEYTDQFDLFGDEWHDLGCDEIFKAGFEAANRGRNNFIIPARYWASNHETAVFFEEDIFEALTAAGIKYTIGE